MKIRIFKSNCLKSRNTSSSSPKVFFGKVVLKLLVISGESLWWSVIFVNRRANGQWSFSFCTSLQVLFFFCVFCISWVALFESTFRRLLLEECFSSWDLVKRPSGDKVFWKFLPYWTIISKSLSGDLLHDCIQLL